MKIYEYSVNNSLIIFKRNIQNYKIIAYELIINDYFVSN